jgi:hypothetical protein
MNESTMGEILIVEVTPHYFDLFLGGSESDVAESTR